MIAPGLTSPFRVAVFAACAYEALAIAAGSDSLPTISAWCARHPWLAFVILAGLAYHFYDGRRTYVASLAVAS